jgi:hypothetical protein
MSRGDLTEEGSKVIEPLLPVERGRWRRPAGDNHKYVNGQIRERDVVSVANGCAVA